MKNQYPENKTNGDSWREKSIIEYSYLVKHIAARFAMRLPSSVFFDELVSAGSLGLIDAVDKFDPSKHVSLKTYAQYRIKGAIL
ncbi:MAG: FliA/WhiG family RNA polymerase sigma factor, partial [Desulfobacula sp.]|uniref:sigma-70 family RNA polymerase sigma factor n=1 Tax=Desulfobacula sp. TaxID=2593537 RepID=UPI0025C59617